MTDNRQVCCQPVSMAMSAKCAGSHLRLLCPEPRSGGPRISARNSRIDGPPWLSSEPTCFVYISGAIPTNYAPCGIWNGRACAISRRCGSIRRLASDYRTIAAFRHDNPEAIVKMSAAFITFGGSKAWCGDLVSLDGTKMRAVASANDIAGAARLTRDIRSYRDEIAIISIGSTSWTIVGGAPWSPGGRSYRLRGRGLNHVRNRHRRHGPAAVSAAWVLRGAKQDDRAAPSRIAATSFTQPG